MKASCVEYSETLSFQDAVLRYLANDEQLKPFIATTPTIASFEKLIQNRTPVNRKVLYDVLKDQYEFIGSNLSEITKNNLEAIKGENTFTVTTGHQLNIFTGPLYFIYKIVTTINLAKELTETHPGKTFVPVYWMATEDHDFDEINHTIISGKKISWNIDAAGATGRMQLDSFKPVLEEYISVLGFSVNATKLAGILKTAYEQSTLSKATRYLVNEIFGKFGLVIIDADDTRLKAEFSEVCFKDITEQTSHQNISQTISKLQELGISAQVNPREINFFYLMDNLRERIVYEDQRYKVLNGDISFTLPELKEEIRNYPERFSPNAVMRPLYQEVILPNVAYVGGGAEIVYWLELKSTFEFYNLSFPALILRNSALLVDSKSAVKLKKLNINYADIFLSVEVLQKKWVRENSEQDLTLKRELDDFNQFFSNLKLKLQGIDSTLVPSAEAVSVRFGRAIQNLEKKIVKAEGRKHADALRQIAQIKESLFPGGSLQERSKNFGSWYVSTGDDFIQTLVDNFKPLDFKFTILS